MEKAEIGQLCQLNIIRSMNDLEIKIMEIQSSVESTADQGQIEILQSKKASLTDLLGTRAQGALVSVSEWYSDGFSL